MSVEETKSAEERDPLDEKDTVIVGNLPSGLTVANLDTVTLYKDTEGDWRWRRRAPNGKIVAASSEGFKRWGYALNNFKRTAMSYKLETE